MAFLIQQSRSQSTVKRLAFFFLFLLRLLRTFILPIVDHRAHLFTL